MKILEKNFLLSRYCSFAANAKRSSLAVGKSNRFMNFCNPVNDQKHPFHRDCAPCQAKNKNRLHG